MQGRPRKGCSWQHGEGGMGRVAWGGWHGEGGMGRVAWGGWHGKGHAGGWHGEGGMGRVAWGGWHGGGWHGEGGMGDGGWHGGGWHGEGGMGRVAWGGWHGEGGMGRVAWGGWHGEGWHGEGGMGRVAWGGWHGEGGMGRVAWEGGMGRVAWGGWHGRVAWGGWHGEGGMGRVAWEGGMGRCIGRVAWGGWHGEGGMGRVAWEGGMGRAAWGGQHTVHSAMEVQGVSRCQVSREGSCAVGGRGAEGRGEGSKGGRGGEAGRQRVDRELRAAEEVGSRGSGQQRGTWKRRVGAVRYTRLSSLNTASSSLGPAVCRSACAAAGKGACSRDCNGVDASATTAAPASAPGGAVLWRGCAQQCRVAGSCASSPLKSNRINPVNRVNWVNRVNRESEEKRWVVVSSARSRQRVVASRFLLAAAIAAAPLLLAVLLGVVVGSACAVQQQRVERGEVAAWHRAVGATSQGAPARRMHSCRPTIRSLEARSPPTARDDARAATHCHITPSARPSQRAHSTPCRSPTASAAAFRAIAEPPPPLCAAAHAAFSLSARPLRRASAAAGELRVASPIDCASSAAFHAAASLAAASGKSAALIRPARSAAAMLATRGDSHVESIDEGGVRTCSHASPTLHNRRVAEDALRRFGGRRARLEGRMRGGDCGGWGEPIGGSGLGSADARNERRGLDVGEGRGATGASVRSEVGGDREGAGYSLHKGQCLPPAAAAAAPGAQQASNRAATAPWAPLRPAGPAPKPTALAAAESAAEAGARAEAAVRADAQAVWARAGEQVGGEVQRLMAPLTRLLLALQGTGRTAGVGGGGTAGVGGGGTAGVGGGGTAGVGGGGTAGVGGGDEEERWEGGGAREAGSDGGWGSAAEGCGGEDAGKGGETSGSERGGGWVERVEALRVVRARGRACRGRAEGGAGGVVEARIDAWRARVMERDAQESMVSGAW
ncbi:unnamed protein product [Closterium sp. NIES-64]|nr:unnamed protein product [Closterium sp. NIES-64]